MIKFTDSYGETVIVYFPNEYIKDNYSKLEQLDTRDSRIIYKITEFTPKLTWWILKHDNLLKIAKYQILGKNTSAIKIFLDDLYDDLCNGSYIEDTNITQSTTKLYYTLTKQCKIIFKHKCSCHLNRFIDDEYYKILNDKKELNFNYFFSK